MNNTSSPILSEQVFGSSKTLQFIKDTMSIKALLDTNGDDTTPPASPKRRWAAIPDDDDDEKDKDRSAKMRKITQSRLLPSEKPMTTVTCLHAAVAQKSYGSEKRFLCPPPVVSVRAPQLPESHLSMAIVCENGDRPLEQRTLLDANMSGSFKYLHVTGTAKAKQFSLRVSLSSTHQPSAQPYAAFLSNPISIISKPSKKTAKARNVSTCILANAPVSLFNRINSQTVRTKYLTSDGSRLCAKNATWSPFDIVLVRPPYTPCPMPVTYGAEIILKDRNTGVQSPPVILRKVDKGRITQAFGPVSQMQKVALQLASSSSSSVVVARQQQQQQQPLYLCAHNAHDSEAHSTPSPPSPSSSSSSTAAAFIEFLPSRIVQPDNKVELAYEVVDDYLFWTIVGISKFEYSFHDASLAKLPRPVVSTISPFPILSSVQYNADLSILDLFGQHLLHLDVWLGPHGPLGTRLVNSQPEQPGSARQSNHVSIELPRHLLSPPPTLEQQQQLPLFFVRPDTQVVYHSGKALQFLHTDDGHQRIWSVRLNNWSVSE